ncbi:ubiquitin family protein [Massilia endophytica]|uniref:hypothetical protein n=1 Tax=Massilia endophytica TaxID=2899220 RepID=UPI001E44CFC7|nr:hypothetical protein [Massilia endophytica]UGQ44949.1 hypothetical protein LSQ66_14195 [Massilia endophytica]
MNDLWEERRKKLAAELERAALEVLGQSGAASVWIPIEGTSPQLYVAVGGLEDIARAVERNRRE